MAQPNYQYEKRQKELAKKKKKEEKLQRKSGGKDEMPALEDEAQASAVEPGSEVESLGQQNLREGK